MFLKKIKKQSRQVGFKITLGHLGLLITSITFLFFVFYFLYTKTLNSKDHEILEAKFQEFSTIYNLGGADALTKSLDELPLIAEDNNIFIRIENSSHNVLYFRTISNTNTFLESEIDEGLKNINDKQQWYYVKTAESDFDIEVFSVKLPTGIFFEIGKKVADQDLLLSRFKKIFIEVLVFAILLGGIGGVLLSNSLLHPLRDLISTLKSINQGNENSRVIISKSNDELEELTLLFNNMLDHIQVSNQGLRQTLDTIAHELRTPLTSIRGRAEITLQKKVIDEANTRKVLEDCIEGIDEILTEFKLMTDITEVESKLLNLQKEKLDLNHLCLEVFDLYEIVAEQKGIALIVDTPMPIMANVDHRQIRRAIANLVDNAIKYSLPDTSITISTEMKYKDALIVIHDQGIGIPRDELQLIWKRLYRGKDSRSEKGIGLGLSLVKSIVEAHQGSVSVLQNHDRGSTFTIRIPC